MPCHAPLTHSGGNCLGPPYRTQPLRALGTLGLLRGVHPMLTVSLPAEMAVAYEEPDSAETWKLALPCQGPVARPDEAPVLRLGSGCITADSASCPREALRTSTLALGRICPKLGCSSMRK